MMITSNYDQRSEEWFLERIGKITGSRVQKVFNKNNLPLVDEMIAEVLTGEVDHIYVNEAMQWGIDKEDEARAVYEAKTGYKVTETGLCTSTTLPFMAVSPDGWIEPEGAVEIKCPKSINHIRTIRMGGVPHQYRGQVIQYFIVNPALEWLDFVSYDPRVVQYPIYIERVWRTDLVGDIAEQISECQKFYKKFQKYLAKFEK